MRKIRKKKKYIISAAVLLGFVVAFLIFRINYLYGNDKKEYYSMESEFEANGYIYKVHGYEIVLSEKTDLQSDTGLKAVLLVKLNLRSNEGSLSVSGANMMVQSDEWGSSMDPELFMFYNKELLNSDWNRKIDEKGQEILVPFPMFDVQFKKFKYENIISKRYEFIVSLTPFKAVELR